MNKKEVVFSCMLIFCLLQLVTAVSYDDCEIYGTCQPTGNIINNINTTINNITIINGSSYNASYVPYTGANNNIDLGSNGISGGDAGHTFILGVAGNNYAGYLANNEMYIEFANAITNLGAYLIDSVHYVNLLKSNVNTYAAKFGVVGDSEYTTFNDGTYAQNILGEITQNGAVTKINSGDFKFYGTDGTFYGAVVDADVGAGGHFYSGNYDASLGTASSAAVFQDGTTYTTFADGTNAINSNAPLVTSSTMKSGTLTTGSGIITDSSGAISFGNENLATTGTVTAEHLKTTDDLEVADDILIGSGSVMNWNVGDITLTHSLNTLTYAGMNTLNLGTSALTTAGTVTAGTLASDSHTSQNNEFSYTANALGAATKSFLPLMMDIYSDPFAFKPISVLEYWNGTAWVAWAGATGQELIDGNSNTLFYADVTHAKWRITIQTGSYLMAGMLHFERSWVNGGVSGTSGAKGFDYLVEDSTTAGGTYTTIASGTFATYSSNSINSQVMLTRHNTAGFWRVTIDASATLSGTERLGFHNMKLLTSGNLGMGYFRGNPWSTSYDKTVTFAGSVSVDSDSNGIILGDGQDAKIYYDGTNLQINPKVVGTGGTQFTGKIGVNSLISSDYTAKITSSAGSGSAYYGLLVDEASTSREAVLLGYSDLAHFGDGTVLVSIGDPFYALNVAGGNAYFSGDVQADSFTEFSNLYSYDTTTAKEDLTSWISGEHPIQLSKNETESRAIISGEIKNKTVGTDIGKAGKATASITLDNAKRLERYDSCLSSSKDFIEYKLCAGGLTG